MQEFEVEEKAPSCKEYFKLMKLHFLAYADLMDFSDFNPTPEQIKKLIESMEQKIKELKKWK